MKQVLIVMSIFVSICAIAQTPVLSFDPILVTTFAGTGESGFADGPSSTAKFGSVAGMAIANGNVFIADGANQRIRKISPDGTVTTFAGTGAAGFIDGPAATAQFNNPSFIAFDKAGNLYVNDSQNKAIRKITPNGMVSTIVQAGTGAAVNFYFFAGLAVDSIGNIYVSQDADIFKITPTGVISLFASNAGDTRGFSLSELAFDAQGNLLVRQYYRRTLKISPGGIITTVPTNIHASNGLTADKKGNIFVSGSEDYDYGNSIVKSSPGGIAVVLAGSDNAGYKDSVGADAKFGVGFMPLAADHAGNIYIGDGRNYRIRKLRVPHLHFATSAGPHSAALYFSISGISMIGAAALQAPAAYELSLNEAGPYSTSLNIAPVAGEINAQKVYIRLRAGIGAGTYNDFVVLSAGGVTTQKMAVSGVVSPSAGNQLVSNAGSNATITLPASSVTLDGSASYNPNGSIVQYYWFQAQGPVSSVVGNNFSAVTAATGLTTAGTYIYVLQVIDNNGVHAYSQKVVTVNAAGTVTVPLCVTNLSPANGITLTSQTTANLRWSPSSNATSYDVYLWTGATAPATPTASTSNNLHLDTTSLTPGTTYSFYVAPRNESGAAIGCATTTKTTFTTASTAGNLPPVSNAGNDDVIMLPASSETLFGNYSSDPDGSIVQYYWFQAQGPVQSVIADNFSAVTTATGLTTPGTYIFVLQVVDNLGVHAYSQKVVTVNPAVAIPACTANTSPTNASTLTTQTTATLTWQASPTAISYDLYLWTGPTAPTTPTTGVDGLMYSVSDLTPGTTYNWYIAPYNIGGEATGCATNKTTFTTAAATAVNQPPVSNAGNDVAITLPASSVTLDASASHDPDGNIAEYYWFQAQGPVQSVVGNNFAKITTATGLTTAGTYIYVLQVTDNAGVHAYAQKVVTVNASGTRIIDSSTPTISALKTNENSSLPSVTAVISPNPVKSDQQARLQINSNKAGTVMVHIVSSQGAVIGNKKVNLVAGINTTTVRTFGLAAGFHVISITGCYKPVNLKLLVQ